MRDAAPARRSSTASCAGAALLPDRVGLLREPLRVLRPGHQARVLIVLSLLVLGADPRGDAAGSISCRAARRGRGCSPWCCCRSRCCCRGCTSRAERWLDRMWFGREFTPVEAVKHVLAAMQPATDEASLIAATEARLTEIFGAQDHRAARRLSRPIEPACEIEVTMPTPVPGEPRAHRGPAASPARAAASEDLELLRSLGGVFGFMLENVRLQRKRQEQEQVAQELRLQTSRSELKALRAQINPHFLFNALNAIASLIHTDPARADAAVEQLAEVFRYTLRRSESEWAPLDQELAFARAYLDVEQARFGQRLTFSIDADPCRRRRRCRRCCCRRWSRTPSSTASRRCAGPAASTYRAHHRRSGHARGARHGPARRNAPRRSQPREGEGFGLRSVRDRLHGHFGDAPRSRLTRDETAASPSRASRCRSSGWRHDSRRARGRRAAGARAHAAAARRSRRRHGRRRSRQRHRGARR